VERWGFYVVTCKGVEKNEQMRSWRKKDGGPAEQESKRRNKPKRL